MKDLGGIPASRILGNYQVYGQNLLSSQPPLTSSISVRKIFIPASMGFWGTSDIGEGAIRRLEDARYECQARMGVKQQRVSPVPTAETQIKV